jgi:hypothetical protein
MGGEEEGEREWKGKEGERDGRGGEGNRIEGKGREWKGRGGRPPQNFWARKRDGRPGGRAITPQNFWARTATPYPLRLSCN